MALRLPPATVDTSTLRQAQGGAAQCIALSYGERVSLFFEIVAETMTKAVEHTCSQIAVINKGEVMYSGSSLNLIQQAENKVWEFVTVEPFSQKEATLISSASVAAGARYRVLAAEPPHLAATQTPPSMEDAYLGMVQNG